MHVLDLRTMEWNLLATRVSASILIVNLCFIALLEPYFSIMPVLTYHFFRFYNSSA